MAQSVDYTDIAAFRNHVELLSDEIKDLQLRGAPSLQFMFPHDGVTGKMQMEWVDIQDLIKPWTAAFAPDDDTVLRKQITIENHLLKAELKFIPKNDFKHWKGHLELMKLKAESYPFARYVIERAAKKVATQLEFDTIWKADLAATPTNAGNFTNGLLTQITDDLAAATPKLTAVATGAITASNAVEKLEQIDDAYDEEYRPSDMPLRMYVSPTVFKHYRRNYRTLSGYHPDYMDKNKKNEIQLDATSTIITSCPGMGTSQRVLLTPQNNIWAAFDYDEGYKTWELEGEVRELKAWSDFWFGVGFHILDNRLVKVNDQT